MRRTLPSSALARSTLAAAAICSATLSFRGRLRNVRCNLNYMETAMTAIEPNFNLDGYEVIGNVIKSGGQAIHCWRHSVNGVVADNLRIHDNTGKPVVVVNSPRGWEAPVSARAAQQPQSSQR